MVLNQKVERALFKNGHAWALPSQQVEAQTLYFMTCQDFPGGSDGKLSVYNARDLGSIHSSTLELKIPWTEELGAGYCPWGRKESGMTE